MLPDRPLNNRDLCEFLSRWLRDNYPSLVATVRQVGLFESPDLSRPLISLPFVLSNPPLPPERRDDDQGARRQAILRVLSARGHRMTITPLMVELGEQGHEWSQRTIEKDLNALKAEGRVNNRTDVKPQGYGFPEWDEPTTPE